MLHANFCSQLFLDCSSCIKCLFVICVVFILSGTPINHPLSCLYAIFLIASFDKCTFVDRFPCFFKGTNLSMILSISYFRMFLHSNLKVLFLNMLFQSGFVKYFLISVYLHVWKFLLYYYLFIYYIIYFYLLLSDFTLMSKCI